ncbi:ATP-binding protein Cassette (ABC) superfamily [Angomonas deanei]|uniref:HotDog ACOT-type domain-containing protein n=1 Tax=Angomonas deanei TaxID=59799 RepID=A0A7G2CJW3_9TRYP|nr:ATP-binding protein Cassette (ABC) superfamily [Angomonas deanei]CAD2218552.1 hypothetical protein, conserved [Angomonas deanei]|eukprot:EPY22742.1 ATP-binding protein Cassette (ABC) superfamily [Angomonas deanei]
MRALRSHAVCFGGKRFAAGTPMILGDRRVGVHKCTDYIYRRRHLIGALSPSGRTRATAGPLLSLADTTSMRAAFYFVNRYTCDGQWEVLEDRTMVTAGFNDVTVVKPIYQGDLLQLEARVVHCRAASLGVYCSVSRQAYDCPVPERVAECYVTAVVLNPSTMKPKSGMIPAVEIEEEEDKGRSAFYSHVIGGRKRKEAGVGGPLTPAECELSTAKPINVSIQESHTLSDWWYVIDALNGNNVVFGGAILGQMERAALHCGRVFCGSPFLFTIGVFDLAFYAPYEVDRHGQVAGEGGGGAP